MKYFLDTEFIEAGPTKPLTLISIGMVCEDGRDYYAVSSAFKEEDCNDWVKANVLPYVGDLPRKTLKDIVEGIMVFVRYGEDIKPEFWGYYADYDWVVFCQMFGSMIDLPKGFPMYCRDIKQLCDSLGNPRLPKQTSTEHNALADAKWNLEAYNFLKAYPRSSSISSCSYCILPAGHDGDHRHFGIPPCPHTFNDGKNTAWGCVLPAGHDGPHKEYAQ